MQIDPEVLSAVAELGLAGGAVMTGLWAVYTYRQSRRMKAARWINDLFNDFYLNEDFEQMRREVEYHYADEMEPLIEGRLTEKDRKEKPLDEAEIELLTQIDDLLNYFEHITYLEQEGHIKKRDREAMFNYWFTLFDQPRFAAGRRYIAKFGFDGVANMLDAPEEDYLVLYGSVMQGFEDHEELDLPEYLNYVGSCTIEGILYDLDDYPGLVLDEEPAQEVHGELYKVTDQMAYSVLDDFERFDPNNREDSLYVRTYARLKEPAVDAWVYEYNDSTEDAKRIESGNWRTYTTQ